MIILASGSPRRKEILESHDIHPKIIVPEADEVLPPGFSDTLTVEQTVMYLALKKGLSVYEPISKEHSSECGWLIAADTIVYDKRIIGKPADKKEAFDILRSLRGKMHEVLTGVAVINLYSGYAQILYDRSKVYFKDYTDDEIKDYVRVESPMDKAGAYAIQSSWAEQVDRVEGDIENVIGLPWYRITSII